MNSLFLGLSSGASCLAYCIPVILPYYLSKGSGVGKNYTRLALFMLGRFVGYIAIGVLAWYAGLLVLRGNPYQTQMMGISYLLMSIALGLDLLWRKNCAAKKINSLGGRLKETGILFPAILGFATGINLCPSFLIAFTEAAAKTHLLDSILFFFLFYLGTGIYFLPVPLIGLLKNVDEIRIIGRILLVLVAGYYFLKGLMFLFLNGGVA